jgi:two-component system uhpT operon response regulator UhpA
VIGSTTFNTALLTPKEREVLGHLCRDVIPKQVADLMGLSVKTIYNHMENIRRKANVNNMIPLYVLALQEGLAELPG